MSSFLSLLLNRHPELVSGLISPPALPPAVAERIPKRVRDDEEGKSDIIGI
jgi:hypothetical protein